MAAGHSVFEQQPTVEIRNVGHTATGALIQSSSAPELPRRAPTAAATGHAARATPDLAAMDDDMDVADVASLTKAVKYGEELAKDALKVRQALADGAPAASVFDGVEFVKPCVGTFTSGFGARWGTTHYGIDLANKIGTPIYAVTDGIVVDSGPASGFGLWVRVLHPSGFTSVYGHINRSLVREGQRVKAGQQIAEMGNRGQSTGPHLHLEIWDALGRKINPLGWLATRGIRVTGTGNGPALH
ncbi:murein DD-endopeptidase MepM/ murein hydrolase activator NlpD [Pseudonocardia eucalypti]|uniref:M23 family metallopeptidase n=1 Tax=Pseudonocardia eucalypti TaxID=648755 RepID=UPI0017B03622|nr:murein DD-endopeptidase MepM/ murein hydrolase activator NlpD [Pseudonocardia eucalypti]